jgi:hypothetical protein
MRRLGFRRLRQTTLAELGVVTIVLAPPPRMSAWRALAILRQADPQGVYELNHVYDPSAGQSSGADAVSARPVVDGAGLKIGMIDGGVMTGHPCLKAASITQRGFAGAATASAHGTAVASLLVGNSVGFTGCAPGAALYAADVFGDEAEGGSAEAVAAALNWLISQGVGVVNISLEGPPNRLLELAARSAAARGIVLVAAVGNAGPSQPVAYPAAYPGVLAATAVDAGGRVYLMANRGPEVAFAAYGVGIAAAVDDGDFEILSGTSFAAPAIAARLAAARRETGDRDKAVALLAAAARDAGAPGRDPVYGYGVLA